MATVFKQVKNNAKAKTVANALDNVATSGEVALASGSNRLPISDDGQFYVTAWRKHLYPDPGDDPSMRVGLVTTRVDNVITVTWGQLNTPIDRLPGTIAVELLVLDQHFKDAYAAINYQEALSTAQAAQIAAKQSLSQKGQPNGYAGLDGNGKVPASQIAGGGGAKRASRTVGSIVGQNADYICDGVDDNVQLQQAIDDLTANGGGDLFVYQGLYSVSRRIWILSSNITVRGSGRGSTTFKLADNANQEIWLIGNGNVGDSAAGDGPTVIQCNDVSFYDFTMDGNKANQVPSAQFAAVRYGPSATRNLLRYRSDAQSSYGGTVQNVHAINGKQNGISCESHALGAFIDCFAEGMDQSGIWVENTSNWNLAQIYTRNNGQDTAIGGSGVRVLSSGGVQVMGLDSKGDRGSALTFLHVGDSSFTGVSAYRTGWQGGANDTASSGIALSDCTNISGSNVNIFGSQGHGLEMNGVKKSNLSNFTFKRNGQKANNTYSDVWITFAGGSSVQNNNFSNFAFNNENPTFYTNKAQYNIGSNAPEAHTGNKFTNMNFGNPVTAQLYQITIGNSFYDTPGVNPIGTFNYGYFDPAQTIDPASGSFLVGTGYTTESTVTIANGKYVGQKFTLRFNQDSGNKQLNWASNVKWSNGKPVFSGVPGSDDLMDFTWDGTNWFGTHNEYDRTYKSYGYFDANVTIDPSVDGSVLDGTGFTSTTNMTFASGRTKGQKFILIFRQDGNANQKNITFGSNVAWSGGTAPVFASGANLFNIFYFTWDGSKWDGFAGSSNFTQAQADLRYLQLTGGTLSGGLNITTPANYASINLTGQNAKLALLGGGQGDNQNYIQSSNAAGNANLPLNITGVNNTVGSTLNLKFANVNLSGKITNMTDPTDAQDGATKNYVDVRGALKYDKTGGTLSGGITVATPSTYAGLNLTGQNAKLALLGGGEGDNQNYIQSSNAAGTANLPLNITGFNNNVGSTLNLKFNNVNLSGKITNMVDPVDPQDGATKAYVDSVATGLDVKASVRAATTANVTLSGAQTIDGVALVAGDRVLVKNQTTASENGIYTVASGAWTRSTDANSNAKVTSGLFTFSTEGTTSGGKGYVLTTADPITLGTTGLTFALFSSNTVGVNSVTAGDATITIGGTSANPTVSVSPAYQATKVNELPDTTVSTAGPLIAGVTSNVTATGSYTAPAPDGTLGTPPKRFAIMNLSGSTISLAFPNQNGTTINLSVLSGEVITFRQKTALGYANESGNKPLAQLDARYGQLAISNTWAGNQNISKSVPELRLTSSDTNYSRISRTDTGNVLGLYNRSLRAAGNALSVNGTSSFAQMNYVSIGTSISLDFWFTLGSGTRTSGALVSYGAGKISADLTQIVWQPNIFGGSVATATTLAVGTKYHVVVTQTGTTYNLWLNGTQIVTNGTAPSAFNDSNNGQSRIGTYNGADGAIATIDELAIYSKVLSAAEITASYNGGAGIYHTPAANLVNLFHFDEGLGAQTINVGTAKGYATFSSTAPTWAASLITDPTAMIEASLFESVNGIEGHMGSRTFYGDNDGTTVIRGRDIRFLDATGVERMRMDANGYFGFGTTAPAAPFSAASAAFANAAASNVTPLSITQNDTTNNPIAVNIQNNGTGVSLNIRTGTASGLDVRQTASNNGTVATFSDSSNSTAGDGRVLDIIAYRTGGGQAVRISTGSASSQADLLQINNSGGGYSIDVSAGRTRLGGSLIQTPNAITAAVTLTIASRQYNTVAAATAAYSVTLPGTTTPGLLFTFKRIDNTANVVTLLGTFDGATNYTLSVQYKYVTVMSTATSGVWLIVNNN